MLLVNSVVHENGQFYRVLAITPEHAIWIDIYKRLADPIEFDLGEIGKPLLLNVLRNNHEIKVSIKPEALPGIS